MRAILGITLYCARGRVHANQIDQGTLGSLSKVPLMRLFRHRRPSLKTLLGVTKAKKRIKKELGVTAAMKPFRWWGNQKRRVKRKIVYESPAGRVLRNGLPKPGGCMVLIIGMLLVRMLGFGVSSGLYATVAI